MSNRKKIIIFSVIAFVFLVLIGVMIFAGKKEVKKDFNLQENLPNNDFQKNLNLSTIEYITGVVGEVDIDFVEIILENDEKIILKVPASGASFFKQVEQENGDIFLKDIGLLNIPQNQTVDVQYDSQTREIRLIIIK